MGTKSDSIRYREGMQAQMPIGTTQIRYNKGGSEMVKSEAVDNGWELKMHAKSDPTQDILLAKQNTSASSSQPWRRAA